MQWYAVWWILDAKRSGKPVRSTWEPGHVVGNAAEECGLPIFQPSSGCFCCISLRVFHNSIRLPRNEYAWRQERSAPVIADKLCSGWRTSRVSSRACPIDELCVCVCSATPPLSAVQNSLREEGRRLTNAALVLTVGDSRILKVGVQGQAKPCWMQDAAEVPPVQYRSHIHDTQPDWQKPLR